MHPLITAWLRYQAALDLNIRLQSPYYSEWRRLVKKARDWYEELLELEVIQ